MALSRIWSAFIIVAILVASLQYFSGSNRSVFSNMVIGKNTDTLSSTIMDSSMLPAAITLKLQTDKDASWGTNTVIKIKEGQYLSYRMLQANGVIQTCKDSVELCLGLIGVLALFMGFLSIAEKAGGVRFLSRIVGPFFTKLFPEVPKNHPAIGHMMMNFSANLLNLDNAATPFGLKAMESLQELNPNKSTASNAQLMFLCLHASGLTFIPVTIIAARASLKAPDATEIFIPCVIATFAATLAALLIVSIKQKINLIQPVILAWVLGVSAVIIALVLYMQHLNADAVQSFSKLLSNGLVLLIFFLIVIGALYKKINVFDAFVEGAKGGFETAVRIIPYIVGMLVAISLLRNSGTFDFIIDGLRSFFASIGTDTRFVDGLPTALIKPLSGSGARGMMVDTMKTFGTESFAGRLACILQGSSDTTFYVIAVYFGSVSIRNTRYAAGAMLLADLVGIITSILICYLFFG